MGVRTCAFTFDNEGQSEDIHDHEWDYSSRVLYGSPFARECKIGSPNHGQLQYEYYVQSGLDGLSRLTLIGEVFIAGSEPSEATAGSTHYLEADRHHSAYCKVETLGSTSGRQERSLQPQRLNGELEADDPSPEGRRRKINPRMPDTMPIRIRTAMLKPTSTIWAS